MTTRRLTRIVTAALAAASVTVALAACSTGGGSATGASASPQGGLTLAEVQDAGELVIGTEGTYRPYSFHEGGAGDLTGYDVDVVTAVAEKLGVEPVFEETQFDAIFAGLQAGRFDVIANQISINPERQETYDFSEPYTISPGVLIVPDGSDITSFADLSGRTSAQSLTSNWYQVAEDAGATVEQVEGWAQAVELLRQGRVDATVNDELTFLDYQTTEGDDIGIQIVAQTDDVSENAFAFRKGSTTLVDAVNDALAELRADGTLAEISDRYFGQDVSQ